MKVLAVDTSSLVISVAIVEPKILIAEYVLNQEKNHSMKTVPAIEMVVDDCGENIKNMDVFAVAHGPGSFTGLRIGVATIKALAQALDRPVVGVSTLDGLAFNLAYAEGLICPIMDARRQQVYTSVYKFCDGRLTRLEEYMAAPLKELIGLLSKWDEPVNFCGDGILAYRQLIEQEMGSRARFAPPVHALQRASSIAWLALERALEGQIQRYWELKPFYLRKSQAEQKFGSFDGSKEVSS
ncbi:MAG: tRNA (adenosine(37)-N6)-threonylcarbamoyltransferase complex dimerization subunit type 1 TsaB [Clostridiales bacterium]|jgi:tRNA threonylcarbamoyladenosine biosynthesis protein TsaB|nr:tRNA (adenosine(37)-N6)-threonylcarbamoyltransferase complex dimerization subunit type 1 TsaB [Clostridiales bacterium]